MAEGDEQQKVNDNQDQAPKQPKRKKKDSEPRIIDRIKESKSLIRPLRTYESDVAKFVKKEKVSTSKIVVAEQKRRLERQATKEVQNDKKKVATGLKLSMILILLGVLAIGSTFFFLDPVGMVQDLINRNPDEPFDPTLIDKTEEIRIASDNKVNIEVKREVADAITSPPQIAQGDLVEFIITKRDLINVGEETLLSDPRKIPADEFIQIMELDMPEGMIRSINPEYIFALINTQNGTSPFILFTTSEADRVFSGMFEWESTMYRDVNDIFFETLGVNDFISTETPAIESTSTDDLFEMTDFDPNNLVDVVIFNRDTRAIVDTNGNILFFYTLLDSENLLLASDKAVVELVVQKLNLQKLVR